MNYLVELNDLTAVLRYILRNWVYVLRRRREVSRRGKVERQHCLLTLLGDASNGHTRSLLFIVLARSLSIYGRKPAKDR
jgi:hypothetical protein